MVLDPHSPLSDRSEPDVLCQNLCMLQPRDQCRTVFKDPGAVVGAQRERGPVVRGVDGADDDTIPTEIDNEVRVRQCYVFTCGEADRSSRDKWVLLSSSSF